MIPSLEELRQSVHTQMKNLRNIDLLVNNEKFAEDWNTLTEDEKLQVVNHIQWSNKDGLQELLKSHKKPLGDMSVRELWDVARKRGLKTFTRLSKTTLLSELSKLEGAGYDEE